MKKFLILLFVGILFIPIASAEDVLRIRFDISQNGSVEGFDYGVIDGRADPKTTGNCMIMLYDESDNLVYITGKDVTFTAYDAQVEMNTVQFISKVPFTREAKLIKVFFKGENIFSKILNFCNNDGICDQNENYLSCPADCPADKKDGICINKPDGICDPDCIKGYDPDCISQNGNCGNGKCETELSENFASCPSDCSGAKDGICDRQTDGICDPDCPERNDIDCQETRKGNPLIVPLIIAIVVVIGVVAGVFSYKKTKSRNEQNDYMGVGGSYEHRQI